jgi:hypothetical protein
MSWSKAAAGICAQYTFLMRRKKWSKYAKHFGCGACSTM